ncbi:hypothetical protein B0T16DRAFT_14050 [Cercophora newfieldiana]|uniref:Uncharacterized protein n=1 Tax=Cercophora newfieldiana TaxID=92897 RepID=A0AA40CXV1_9PEZI|nr:hypothetical protein B0T16DRAFT_14050 [Cercophora newfieldiana]
MKTFTLVKRLRLRHILVRLPMSPLHLSTSQQFHAAARQSPCGHKSHPPPTPAPRFERGWCS